MRHKHPTVAVQQRSLNSGCSTSLYPGTVRSPEPSPAALLPARNLRPDTPRSPPQGPRARAGRHHRPAGRGPALSPHSLLLTDLSARAKSPFCPQRFTSLHSPAAAAAPAAAAILAPGPDTRRGGGAAPEAEVPSGAPPPARAGLFRQLRPARGRGAGVVSVPCGFEYEV